MNSKLIKYIILFSGYGLVISNVLIVVISFIYDNHPKWDSFTIFFYILFGFGSAFLISIIVCCIVSAVLRKKYKPVEIVESVVIEEGENNA